MRAHAEMTVDRASDGIQIDLKTGDIIITAAKQRDGHLYVRTSDMTVAVEGTAFLAHAGRQGSRVGVIEGEVRVREGREDAVETLLRPGEQIATSPVLAARAVRDDILWSRNANVHLAVIDTFMKGVAQSAAPLTPLARQADVTGAQTAGTPAAALEFEEASIRPCDPDNLPAAVPGARGGGGGANAVYMTPGRFYALCMTPATRTRSWCLVVRRIQMRLDACPALTEAQWPHTAPKTASAFAEGQTGCEPRSTRSRRLRGLAMARTHAFLALLVVVLLPRPRA
jgi:hypothetical protein